MYRILPGTRYCKNKLLRISKLSMSEKTTDSAATVLDNPEPAALPEPDGWKIEDAETLYHIERWGSPYFRANSQGNMSVRPVFDSDIEVDLMKVIREVRSRGIQLPVLLRFQDLLRRRVIELNESFRRAIEEFEYAGLYQGVYPIKVNQLHEVVLEILDAGETYNYGLECGSKAELLAALPHLERDNMLLICNGYKDSTMHSLILTAQRLGKKVLPIIEKYHEFTDLISEGDERSIQPSFGVRIRLATTGSGRWAESGGDASKFGVPVPQVLQIVEELKRRDATDSFQLVHFHIGSQIQDIITLKGAVREITRVYAKLHKMGIGVKYIDVGGGLGVNYDAVDSGLDQSINYTLQEYVNGVVYTIKEICDIEEVPHPIIVTESGRAITAHHSVLVVGVLGSTRKDVNGPVPEVTEDDEPVNRELIDVLETLRNVTEDTRRGEAQRRARCLELYHDTVEKKGEADLLFSLGYLSLEDKGKAETLYWIILNRLYRTLKTFDKDSLPTDLYNLDEMLVDQYLCDFSVFQSMLDHWAIDQLFPIMPLHRLNEEPDRRGTLVDLTCDSDGKIDRFIGDDGESNFLELHTLDDNPYYLGCFLMGAYQDILGDMHNLFGRVNEVHVYADDEEPDNFYIETYIPGTNITEALSLVQYSSTDLRKRMDAIIREKVKDKHVRPRQGVEFLDQYSGALKEYTYYNFRERNREK